MYVCCHICQKICFCPKKNGLNFNSMTLTHCVMLDVEMLLNLLELEAMAECEDLHD